MVNTLISDQDNPFWQFSLKLYQHEKVKEACLSFQDQEGVNVNLLLLCCWLSYAIEAVSPIEFNQASQLIVQWHLQVTQPLRQVRHYLKAEQKNNQWIKLFYQQILADEITSESQQQYVLYSYFASKQKSKCFLNKEILLCYIGWLFKAMKIPLSDELNTKTHSFIEIIQGILE